MARKKRKSQAVLKSSFDVTKVEIIKRGDERTLVRVIEGSMKGQTVEAENKSIHSLKEYHTLHNNIYH